MKLRHTTTLGLDSLSKYTWFCIVVGIDLRNMCEIFLSFIWLFQGPFSITGKETACIVRF